MSRMSQSVRAMALGAVALFAVTSVARAQMTVHAVVSPAIAVSSPAGLDFGAVTRPSTTDIIFSAPTTGIIQVDGAVSASVLVTFQTSVVLSGGAVPPTYTVLPASVGTKTILSGTCDRTGVANVDVTVGTITSNLGPGGTLCYTVGGRLVAVAGTTPGSYSGTLAVTVTY
jgi:hypothetical protein